MGNAKPAEAKAARQAVARARGVTGVVSQVKAQSAETTLVDVFHSQVNNDQER